MNISGRLTSFKLLMADHNFAQLSGIDADPINLLNTMYTEEIEILIKRIVGKYRTDSFDKICKQLKGCFPDIAFNLLTEEQRDVFQVKSPYIIISSYSSPEPNLADYEWRFTESSTRKICNSIKINGSKIALFGTPSIFYFLCNIDADVTLFDINNLFQPVNYKNRIINFDLNNNKLDQDHIYDYVIMDPPWYAQDYSNWLYQASRILKTGGKIFLSLFQDLLRPNARNERNNILSLCKSIGDYTIKRNFILYETPFFEKELFSTLNIPIRSDWRVADLVVVTLSSTGKIEFEPKSFASDWSRCIIGNQTLAMKFDSYAYDDISASYPYPNNGTVLKSVSNRYHKRNEINFITSRNRALIVKGQDKLRKIFNSYVKDYNFERIISDSSFSSEEKKAIKLIFTTFGY